MVIWGLLHFNLEARIAPFEIPVGKTDSLFWWQVHVYAFLLIQRPQIEQLI